MFGYKVISVFVSFFYQKKFYIFNKKALKIICDLIQTDLISNMIW